MNADHLCLHVHTPITLETNSKPTTFSFIGNETSNSPTALYSTNQNREKKSNKGQL